MLLMLVVMTGVAPISLYMLVPALPVLATDFGRDISVAQMTVSLYMTCTLEARRASRPPIASATAPPTPVSISSNTNVGAEPRSDSTTLSASKKRDNSPPEATLIIGPGLVPGLVCTQNSTRSMPSGPGAAGLLSTWVMVREQ